MDAVQLSDDLELLSLLEADEATAGVRREEPPWLVEVRRSGLHDLRRTNLTALWDLGVVELPPSVVPRRSIRRAGWRLRRRLLPFLDLVESVPAAPVLPMGLSLQDLHQSAYRISALRGQVAGARPLDELRASLAGHPASHFEVDGRPYTLSFLSAYWRYAFAAESLDLDAFTRVVVFGPGLGVLAELLHKAHPSLEILLVGTAGELYLAERFLRATFGDLVEDYRSTRRRDAWGDVHPGRIRIPALQTAPAGRTTAPTLVVRVEPPTAFADGPRSIAELVPLADALYSCRPRASLDDVPPEGFEPLASGAAHDPLVRRSNTGGKPYEEHLQVRESCLGSSLVHGRAAA